MKTSTGSDDYDLHRIVAEQKQRIADLEDELKYIPRQELADMMELSGGRVSILVRDGIIPQDSSSRYVRRDSVHAAFAWMRGRLGEGTNDAQLAKAEKVRLENIILKSQADKAQGSVISIDEAKKVIENLVLHARGKALGLANKIAPRVAYMKSEIEVENAIQTEVEEFLSELSRPVEFDTKPEKEDESLE